LLSRARHPWTARYAAAALAVAAAFALTALLDPFLQEGSPFLLLSAAVLVAAAYGGVGPGVFATLLGAVAGDYFFLSPVGTLLPPDAAHGLTTGLFLAQGLAISALGAWLSSARRRAHEGARRATESRARLGESEERYRLLVEGATEYAILMLDPEGRVASWNAGARRILGYAGEEILGEHFSVFFTEEDRREDRPGREFELAVTEGRASNDTWSVRKDGSRFWASGVTTALRDGDGNLRGLAKILRDRTEARLAEEALREIREAERSRIARDLHDGPLQDLSYGLAEVYLAEMDLEDDHPASAALGRASEPLRRVSVGLRAAVNDLRQGEELSQSLPELVRYLVERARSMDPGCDVRLEVEDGFPSTPVGDVGVELSRAIREALTNARRHSGADNVRVTLRTDGDVLVAEIADDGRGIGTGTEPGVGLNSMKERAAAVGGELRIESEPGRGTTVRLRIPTRAGLREGPQDEHRPDPEGR
jgi:PAS domain S-box-containing protein